MIINYICHRYHKLKIENIAERDIDLSIVSNFEDKMRMDSSQDTCLHNFESIEREIGHMEMEIERRWDVDTGS